MFCEKCGQLIPAGQNVCPHCGLEIPSEPQRFDTPNREVFQNPNYTVPPTENNFSSYGNQDVELLVAYVGKGPSERLFKMADTGKGINIPAALLGPWYYFYRKVYLGAFISGVVASIAAAIVSTLLDLLKLDTVAKFSGVVLLPIWGLLFPYFYKRNADKALARVKTEYASTPLEGQKKIMESLGGTSFGSFFAIFGINGVFSGVIIILVLMFIGAYFLTHGNSNINLDLFPTFAMWFYICQAIILIVATVLLFRDHNNMNKNLAGFVEGTLTIKNLVLGIIALFFAIISLVFIYVAPVLVDETMNTMKEKVEEIEETPENSVPVEVPDSTTTSESPQEVTPEPSLEPVPEETPEIVSTPADSDGQYLLQLAPNQTITLSDIPGMRVSLYDENSQSSISFVSDKEKGATDNVMVMYMVSLSSENLDKAGEYSGFDKEDTSSQYSFVEKKEVMLNGKRCLAYHYGYPGNSASYMSLFQDIGASKLIQVAVTDWNNTYTFDELIDNYSIILD